MTVAPRTPVQEIATLEEALGALRAGGMRVSTPRRLVLEALFAAPGPVPAATLAAGLEVDESSVYRNLEVLERHGMVRHVHLGHGPGLYLLAGRTGAGYLYCDQCAAVTTAQTAELDAVSAVIEERFGLVPDFSHFAIVGRCAACAAERPEPQSSEPPGGTTHS